MKTRTVSVSKSSNTARNVAIGVALLMILGVTAYFLRNWIKTKVESLSNSKPVTINEAGVTNIGMIDEVTHTAVVKPENIEPAIVPPGGFPVSGCVPSNLHEHIYKEYATYETAQPSKAFVATNDCAQSFAISGQSDSVVATRKAYETCNQKMPSQCGVVAVNDVVYAKPSTVQSN